MNLLSLVVENTDNRRTYPFATELYRKGFSIDFAPITVIVGENGVGKSTLLESLAYSMGFPTYGGNMNSEVYLGELNRVVEHNNSGCPSLYTLSEVLNDDPDKRVQIDNNVLSQYIKLKWRIRSKKGMFIRAETFAMIINIPRYHAQDRSHGEGIVDIVSEIHDDGVYVLDEPESGLSPTKIMELMVLMDKKQREYGCQFILSTHNPMLMCIPNCKLLEMTESELKETIPERTSHYEITRSFLNKKEKFLADLFDEE